MQIKTREKKYQYDFLCNFNRMQLPIYLYPDYTILLHVFCYSPCLLICCILFNVNMDVFGFTQDQSEVGRVGTCSWLQTSISFFIFKTVILSVIPLLLNGFVF